LFFYDLDLNILDKSSLKLFLALAKFEEASARSFTLGTAAAATGGSSLASSETTSCC